MFKNREMLRLYGFMVIRFCGCMVIRFCGCMVIRFCGYESDWPLPVKACSLPYFNLTSALLLPVRYRYGLYKAFVWYR